jgi:hypothetical protein
LHISTDIFRAIKSKRMRWEGHASRVGEMRNAYRILVGMPDGKRQLGRFGRRWEDNIRMDLKETGSEDVDRIHLAHDKDQWRVLMNAVLNFRVP